MPLYEYRCAKCAKLLEVIQGFKDAPLKKCESCGGRLEKLISRSGFVLKGSGWYASDYNTNTKAKGPKSDATEADAPAEKAAGAAADTGSTSGAQESPKDKPAKPVEKSAGSSDKAARSSRKGGASKD